MSVIVGEPFDLALTEARPHRVDTFPPAWYVYRVNQTRPRAFLELPAGLAACSLRLHGGAACKPPISRQGVKTGYAEAILWTLGLRAGLGADAYLWAEADPDVAALLRCYPDAAMLRAVADIIRGWADEEPRALWERLRAERKARGPRVDVEGAAGCVILHRWSFSEKGPDKGYGGPGCEVRTAPGGWTTEGRDLALGCENTADRCRRLAEYAQIASANRLINVAGPELRNTGKGGTTFGGEEFATPAGELADRFAEVAREVAGHAVTGAWAMRSGIPESGYTESRTGTGIGEGHGDSAASIGDRFPRVPSSWPPVAVLPRIPAAADVARWLGTPGDLAGVVCYADPPYLNTSGYAHNLTRTEVVAIARDYAALGAHVAVSEAEPLADLVGEGWHVANLTGGRRGSKRTFSKQQTEYLTMNREPAYRVATQPSMFALAPVAANPAPSEPSPSALAPSEPSPGAK